MSPLEEIHDRKRLCGMARATFMPAAHEEWRWTEGGTVLEWADGTTICFAEELALIFRRLEPRRMADFRSVVYVLAACRGKIPDPGRIGALPEGEHRRTHLLLAKLRLLGGIDPALLRSVEARAELLDMVLPFQDVTGPPEISRLDLLTVWREEAATEELNFAVTRFDLRPLFALYAGLNEFTEERLRLRLRTGLDELPGPAELPEVQTCSIRALLEELKDDPELGGMARLAREIMAALKVPRALATPEDLPVGGWADISNRGTPDRLLLSELAQDPLMLSIRVAQNEALYLRREPPARREEPPAALLIDTGLRLWGVPRIFAASVALAIAASREAENAAAAAQVQCWLTSPGGTDPCPLRSREDLVRLLEQLHPGLDPMPALRDFVSKLQDQSHPTTEPFFITHRDHLEDAAFRNALRTEGIPALFLATVDRAGDFALHRWEPQRGLKLLSHASLDLTKLVASPRPLMKSGDLPAFLLQRPEPLSIPPRGEVLFSVTASDAAGGFSFAAMSDGSILRWKGHHCVMVVRKRPPGRVIHMHPMGLHEVAVVIIQDDIRMCQMNIADSVPYWLLGKTPEVLIVRDLETEILRLEKPLNWSQISSYGEYLYFLSQGPVIVACNFLTGKAAGTYQPVHQKRLLPGAILELREGQFLALRVDGDRVKLVSLPPLPDRKCMAAAWRAAASGRIEALSTDGWHYYLADAEWTPGWNSNARLGDQTIHVSTDGKQVQLVDSPCMRAAMLVLDRRIQNRSTRLEHRFSSCTSEKLPRRNCRANLTRAGVSDSGELRLQTQKGQTLCPQWRRGQVGWQVTKAPPSDISWIDFKPLAHPELTLHEAVFPGGRVVLDRRGFLHLQAWRGNHPEITLPLDEAFSVAWSSAQTGAGGDISAGVLEALVREMACGGGAR